MSRKVIEINQYIRALEEERSMYWSISIPILLSILFTHKLDSLGMVLLPFQIGTALWFIYLATIEYSAKKKNLEQLLRKAIEESNT